jgi:ribosomal subunit interface protein
MRTQLQITFRNMGTSEAIEAQIRQRTEELERFYSRITGCHVIVESGYRQRRKGRIFHVLVDVIVPGGEIVVKRDPSEHNAHEDVYVAIRDAFDATRRQLEDHLRRIRGQTKTREPKDRGKIVKLFPEKDYGFIAAADGQEIYMHRNSVTDAGFDKLRVGDEVRYVVHSGEGEKGPQASTVIALGKHYPSPV